MGPMVYLEVTRNPPLWLPSPCTHTQKDPDQREARLTLWHGEQNGLSFEKRFKGDTQVAQSVKNLPAMQETWVLSLDQGDPLKKEMATHSSILAWQIP